MLKLGPAQWGDQISKAETDTLESLIKAGFDPQDALRVLGLPSIKHLGLPPVTVQKAADAEPPGEQLQLDMPPEVQS
jgi:hypothetical protein